jgi:mRNA-degrading endonuclease toxin of MazEF toxin-antitoxin module
MFVEKEKELEYSNVPKLGEIYYADLTTNTGIAQQGIRPVIVAQNSYVVERNSMVWVIPLTSRIKALHIPVHVVIKADNKNRLNSDSMTLVESMSYIDKNKLISKIGTVSSEYYSKIGDAIKNQFPFSKVSNE